jgi:hypothetical protein
MTDAPESPEKNVVAVQMVDGKATVTTQGDPSPDALEAGQRLAAIVQAFAPTATAGGTDG